MFSIGWPLLILVYSSLFSAQILQNSPDVWKDVSFENSYTPFTRYKRLSNRLSNRLNKKLDNRLYRAHKHSTGWTTGCATVIAQLKPNSITLSGSNQLRTSSEPASVIAFGFFRQPLGQTVECLFTRCLDNRLYRVNGVLRAVSVRYMKSRPGAQWSWQRRLRKRSRVRYVTRFTCSFARAVTIAVFLVFEQPRNFRQKFDKNR